MKLIYVLIIDRDVYIIRRVIAANIIQWISAWFIYGKTTIDVLHGKCTGASQIHEG
jgi:hypothetical protein